MSITNTTSSYITSQIQSVQKEGIGSYLLEKVQERNPLLHSTDYQKQSRTLKKRLAVLKAMRKDRQNQLKQSADPALKRQLQQLDQRIINLQRDFHYLKEQEQAKMLLKWSTPFNLILPGTGDSIRITAYSLKALNALNYQLQQSHSLEEIKKIGKEISLAFSFSTTSRFVYDKVRALKNYLTYPSFSSLLNYSFKM